MLWSLIFGVLGFLCFLSLMIWTWDGTEGIKLTFIFGFSLLSIYCYNTDPQVISEKENEESARAAKKLAQRQPRPYSKSADGCTIFTFRQDNDKWGYYTQCPNSTTTTDFGYNVTSGKTTKEVREQIVTKEKK